MAPPPMTTTLLEYKRCSTVVTIWLSLVLLKELEVRNSLDGNFENISDLLVLKVVQSVL